MINKQEIMEHAKKHGLPSNTIEKDYVLNWLLRGIASSSELKDKWIFKGGTCLKKCFFKERGQVYGYKVRINQPS